MEYKQASDGKTINDNLENGDVIVDKESNNLTGNKEVAVMGNYCEDDDPFLHDLYPGEKILKEHWVIQTGPGLTWKDKILIYLTCGLYYLYLRYCACCRGMQLFGGRAKLAITNQHRVLLWDSEIHGTQTASMCCGMIPGFRMLDSRTVIATFSIRKLSYVERGYARENVCCGCANPRLDSSMRLFFNDYPDQTIVDAMSFSALPRAVAMSKLAAVPQSYWWSFAFYRFFGATSASGDSPLSAAIAGLAASMYGCFDKIKTRIAFTKFGWGTINVLDIYSPVSDRNKKDKNGADWTSMLQLEAELLDLKNAPVALAAPELQDPDVYTATNEAVHIVDGPIPGRVNLRMRDLGLTKGEHIVDVFPLRTAWNCDDIFTTISTLGIHYFMYVRKKLATRGALVLTNKRLFEVFAYSLEGKFDPEIKEEVQDFNLTVRFWFFGKLSQGYVEWNNSLVWGHFKTKYGGLVVYPDIPETNCCIPYFYGIRQEYRDRVKRFLMKFSQVADAPLLGEELAAPLNPESWTARYWTPIPGERPLRTIESEFSWDCHNSCMYYLNCGIQPIVPAQEFLISTHRLWASAHASNAPWCLPECLNARNDVIYWKPLKDIKGWRVVGNASFSEDCAKRYCQCIPGCTPLAASVNVEVATAKSFPISLLRHGTYPKYGKVAEMPIREWRHLMSRVMVEANKANGYSDSS